MYSARVLTVMVGLALAGPVFAQPVPVVIVADDAQDDNWENVTTAAFETHVEEGVPLSLGVIPCAHGSTTSESGEVTCLEDTDGTVFHDLYPRWIRDNPGLFEVVHHSTTHDTNERLENFDRPTQLAIVGAGLDRMATWGLPGGQPRVFSVPFASADDNTVSVTEQLAYRGFMKASQTFSLSSDEIEIFVHPVLACELDGEGQPVDGADCVLRSPQDLVDSAKARAQELEDNGAVGVVTVLYHVQDLLISNVDGMEDVDPDKVADLRAILQAFRAEEDAGGVDLMTFGGILGDPRVVAALGGGDGGPEVRVFAVPTPSSPIQESSFFAYDEGFRGGVRVAAFPGGHQVATGPGFGGGPHVRLFDTSDPGNVTRLGGFFAYPKDFRGGVSLATGNAGGDAGIELVTAPGAGGQPIIKVFDVADPRSPSEISSFLAYNDTFRGAVNVAVGDVDGDGTDDVVTGPVGAGGPHVRVFDVSNPAAPQRIAGIMAYSREFRGGVFVGAGDLDGDGVAEIVTAPAEAGGPHVRVFSLQDGTLEPVAGILAYEREFRGGVRVAAHDVDGDGLDEVLVAPGPGRAPDVKGYDLDSGKLVPNDLAFEPFPSTPEGGLFVDAAVP